VRLDIHPKNFLQREIDLRYSRAYGPGSYHTGYEKGRLDYPFGYVRWTEKRNLEEFVRLVSTGAVSVEPLIGAVYDVDDAQQARVLPDRFDMAVLQAPFGHPFAGHVHVHHALRVFHPVQNATPVCACL